MPPILSLLLASQLFLLAYASIPRPSSGHGPLNITLGGTVGVWASVPGRAFVEFWLVAQHPNGSYELGGGVSANVGLLHNISITEDGTLVVRDMSNGTMCSRTNQGTYLGGSDFKPRQAGNYSLIPYFLYYFHDGSDAYRYPNSSTVCVETPVKVEAAAAPRLALQVKDVATSTETSDQNLPTSTWQFNPQPVTEVSLTPEPTGDAFWIPSSSSGVLTVHNGLSAQLLGALVLSAIFL